MERTQARDPLNSTEVSSRGNSPREEARTFNPPRRHPLVHYKTDDTQISLSRERTHATSWSSNLSWVAFPKNRFTSTAYTPQPTPDTRTGLLCLALQKKTKFWHNPTGVISTARPCHPRPPPPSRPWARYRSHCHSLRLL